MEPVKWSPEQRAEQALVARILGGDRASFKQLVDDYQRLVAHIVFKIVKDTAEREEVCQDVFVKVYQHLEGFKFQSKLGTWIGRIAYHHSLNHIKKKKAPTVFFEDLASKIGTEAGRALEERLGRKTKAAIADTTTAPDRVLQATAVTGYLREEIDNLPAVYRTILTLYHEQDMSYKEIGDMLDLPEGTVKSYLFRARQKLKEQLLEKYSQEELWNG